VGRRAHADVRASPGSGFRLGRKARWGTCGQPLFEGRPAAPRGTSLPSGPCAVMLVTLPVSARQRKRALDWLIANRIGHLVLFQAVKIHDARDAERFKAWLADAA
jgi:hypothetical protein